MEIITTRTFERFVRKLTSAGAHREMETAIAADPTAAPVILGTGGIRKLRWSGSGRGKRDRSGRKTSVSGAMSRNFSAPGAVRTA